MGFGKLRFFTSAVRRVRGHVSLFHIKLNAQLRAVRRALAHTKRLTAFLPALPWPPGEIISWAALDREERAHHELRVLVTDAGRPRRSATAAVRVCVRDRNDLAPRFPQGALRRQVRPPRGHRNRGASRTPHSSHPCHRLVPCQSQRITPLLNSVRVPGGTEPFWFPTPESAVLKVVGLVLCADRDRGLLELCYLTGS